MSVGAQSSAVRISNLNFRYERSQALHDISLDLPRGCRVGAILDHLCFWGSNCQLESLTSDLARVVTAIDRISDL